MRGRNQKLFSEQCANVLQAIRNGAQQHKEICGATGLSGGYISDIMSFLYHKQAVRRVPKAGWRGGALALTSLGERMLEASKPKGVSS